MPDRQFGGSGRRNIPIPIGQIQPIIDTALILNLLINPQLKILKIPPTKSKPPLFIFNANLPEQVEIVRLALAVFGDEVFYDWADLEEEALGGALVGVDVFYWGVLVGADDVGCFLFCSGVNK